jgi:DNA-binding MarR family transcriptional regulator
MDAPAMTDTQAVRASLASPQSPRLELEEFLLTAHRLANALNDSNILRKHGITVGEWSILNALSARKQLPLQNIVHISGVSRQRINKVLRDLEGKKLVFVGQTENGDRRRRIVGETAKAARVRQAILEDLDQLLTALIAQSPHEQDRSRFAHRFGAMARLANRIARTLKVGLTKSAARASVAPAGQRSREGR